MREAAKGKLTLVTEAVTASISRSSADRSLKPGRTCLAWSLSRVATGREGEKKRKDDVSLSSNSSSRREGRDEPLMLMPERRALTESEVSTLRDDRK